MSDAYLPRHARPSRLRAVLGGLAQAVIALTVIALAAWFLNMPHGALPAGPYVPDSTPASAPGQHAASMTPRPRPPHPRPPLPGTWLSSSCRAVPRCHTSRKPCTATLIPSWANLVRT